ncbi:prealbumin-like fold domain-containing protein [Fulvivirga maritima]|uniref:SpaA isopeptide-forming pilin-related protein n=1 Tax=Fulvivirga maritima TaxID=2904247 RepID=UPI001F454DE3|nr:SpaA isopeptide-forming pilin-related protein [Fulvivirga maritima]UII26217.1 prealbumin-like fold domain-containing protein [Fulvivirga maritima]
MRKLYILLFVSVFMFGCKDDNEVKVTIKDSANLTLTLTQKGTPLSGIYFKVISKANDLIIKEGITDEKGVIDFEQLKEGDYWVSAETYLEEERLKYEFKRVVQVIADQNKDLVWDTEDFTVNMEFYTLNSDENASVPNQKILIYQNNEVNELIYDFPEKLEQGITVTTDENGRANIDLPESVYFSVYWYENEENYIKISGNEQLITGEDEYLSIDLY